MDTIYGTPIKKTSIQSSFAPAQSGVGDYGTPIKRTNVVNQNTPGYSQKEPGFFAELAKPAFKVGTMIGTAGLGIADTLNLLPKEASENLARIKREGFNDETFGNTRVPGAGFDVSKGLTPENIQALKESAGIGLEVASYLGGAGPAKAGIETFRTGKLLTRPLLKSMWQGGKAVAPYTALEATGRSFQDQEKGLEENILDTGVGYVTGLGLGGLFAGGGKALEATGLPQKLFKNVPGRAESGIIKKSQDTQKNFDKALDISRPDIKVVEKQAIEEGGTRIGQRGVFTPAKVAPSRYETPKAEAVQEMLEDGTLHKSNKIKQISALEQRTSQLNQGLDNLTSSSKQTFTDNELNSILQKSKEKNRILFGGDASVEKAYDTVIDEFKTKFLKNRTAKGLQDARKELGQFIKENFEKAFKEDALTANANPRYQALRDIYGAVNEFSADLLDKEALAKVQKTLVPKQAKNLIQKASKFKNKADFIRYAKNNLSEFPESGFVSGTRRKFQAKMKTPNQYSISREQDLGELWDIANTRYDPQTGKLLTDMLRKEHYLLNARQNIASKMKGYTEPGGKFGAVTRSPQFRAIRNMAGAGLTAGGTFYTLNRLFSGDK